MTSEKQRQILQWADEAVDGAWLWQTQKDTVIVGERAARLFASRLTPGRELPSAGFPLTFEEWWPTFAHWVRRNVMQGETATFPDLVAVPGSADERAHHLLRVQILDQVGVVLVLHTDRSAAHAQDLARDEHLRELAVKLTRASGLLLAADALILELPAAIPAIDRIALYVRDLDGMFRRIQQRGFGARFAADTAHLELNDPRLFGVSPSIPTYLGGPQLPPAWSQGESLGCVAFLPLVSTQRVVGLLLVGGEAEDGMSDDVRVLLEGVAAQLTAVLDRLQTERALREAKAETEDVNRHLERALEQASRVAQEADTANAAKSEFLANMSHELRTPLNGVLGMLSLLRESSLTQEQARWAQTSEDSAISLLRILNDILDLSKVQMGQLELAREPFSPLQVVELVLEAQATLARKKGVRVIIRTPTPVPERVLGDELRFGQLVGNLLNNAVKFTDEGEVVLTLTTDGMTGADGTVPLSVTVRDSGPGIAEGQRERIFEPFTQADGGMTRRHGGTGLGLAIARRLADAMGGTLELDSTLGEGSLFRFRAPFHLAPSREPLPIPAPGVACILEREGNGRLSLMEMLGHLGWSVTVHEPLQGIELPVGVFPRVVFAHLAAGEEEALTLLRNLLPATPIVWRGERPPLEVPGVAPARWLPDPLRREPLLSLLRSLDQASLSAPLAAPPPPQTQDRPQNSPAPRCDGPSVLVVEDNDTNRIVATTLLVRLGFRPTEAIDGAEALEQLAKQSFAVVLMDVQMPRLDGIEAVRWLRAAEATAAVPATVVVAITAHAMPTDRERCLEAGMTSYLTKPYGAAQLREILRPHHAKEEGDDGVTLRCPARGEKAEDPVHSQRHHAEPELPSLDFDAPQLVERMLDDEALAQQILHAFVANLPAQLATLEDALRTRNLERMESVCHALKGAAGNVSAPRLQACALLGERAGRQGDFPAAGRSGLLIRSAAARLMSAILPFYRPPTGQ